jgi:hypothetical protein
MLFEPKKVERLLEGSKRFQNFSGVSKCQKQKNKDIVKI